jgi:hypothetical protein
VHGATDPKAFSYTRQSRHELGDADSATVSPKSDLAVAHSRQRAISPVRAEFWCILRVTFRRRPRLAFDRLFA